MIKKVGTTVVLAKHKASCHCGSVVLELDLPHGIVDPRRCNCSICRRKGAIVAFCCNCGIYTHHQRRSNPEEYGFNVGCLEGVNPFDIPHVPTNDGVNHPADRRAS